MHPHTSLTPWGPIVGFRKKEQSVIGKETTMGLKITIKSSCIGDNCSIGPQCKLNNCVIMNNVVVGDKYVLCTVCSVHVRV